jgi:hypothetical protein
MGDDEMMGIEEITALSFSAVTRIIAFVSSISSIPTSPIELDPV